MVLGVALGMIRYQVWQGLTAWPVPALALRGTLSGSPKKYPTVFAVGYFFVPGKAMTCFTPPG